MRTALVGGRTQLAMNPAWNEPSSPWTQREMNPAYKESGSQGIRHEMNAAAMNQACHEPNSP